MEGFMVSDLTAVKTYLEAAKIPLRIACTTESGWPMAVSLWFKHQNGRLFCATQKSARVVTYLKNDPRCAFEIAADLPPYCGVRGQAIARIDESMGPRILEQLLVRYLGGIDSALAQSLIAKSENEVAIILKPVKIYTWDFSSRMQDVILPKVDSMDKVCP
jgi:general stress protein 26